MSSKSPSLPKEGSFTLWRGMKFLGLLLIGAFLVQSVLAVQFSPIEFARGLPELANLVGRMFPPSLESAPQAALASLETVQMAVVGTILAALLSLPLAFLAAQNIAPSTTLYHAARSIIIFTRAIPDLIFALIFVAAVGLGPFPGTLALAISSIGMLGKLYAEAIEEIDFGQVEALRSSGSHPLQTLDFGVVPQVTPALVGMTLYRWDINIRNSVVLGLVGAGGIGFELLTSMRLFQYPEVLTIIIFIFVIILAVERSSSYIRERVI